MPGFLEKLGENFPRGGVVVINKEITAARGAAGGKQRFVISEEGGGGAGTVIQPVFDVIGVGGDIRPMGFDIAAAHYKEAAGEV